MAKSDGSVIIDTLVDTQGFGKGINTMQKQMGGLSKTIGKLGLAIGAAFSVRSLINFGKEAIELGSDLQEVQNVVDVTFTTMSDKVNEFARGAAEAAGLSETMAKKYMGTFGAMSKSFGFMEDEAFAMSASLTQAVGDVASFYNLSQEEAYTKLKAVFTGETESLKDLGVVMTQNALDAYAMAEGWGMTTAQMTEQQKVALRYKFVLDQLSAASGDFERTSGSWANQTRILKLNIESLKANIGQGLINIFTPIIQAINKIIAKIAELSAYFVAFSELISGESTSSGGGSPGDNLDGISEGYEDIEDSIDGATKAQNKYLSGLDEVRTFSPADSGSGAGGSSNIDLGELNFGENVFSEKEIPDFVKEFANKFKEIVEKIKSYIMNEDWSGLGQYISDGIVLALNWISEKIDKVDWNGIGTRIGEFLYGIDWLNVIKSGFKLKFNIWKAIAEVWFGAFKAAPIETSIITAFAALKFTRLGDILIPKIVKAIVSTKLISGLITALASLGGLGGILTTDLATIMGAGSLAEIGLTLGTGIIGGIVAAFAGFEFGKELGKFINPADEEWYDNFKWFGEDGFFDIIAKDLGTTLDAIVAMANDFENNPVIATLTRVIGGPFVVLPANLSLAKEKLTEFKDFLTKWWEKDIAPHFTKEKWTEGMQGVKDAFDTVWKGAVNIVITLVNKMIDKINDAMSFEWDPLVLFGQEIIPGGSAKLFTIPKIPMLATGAVIPPNAPFMAVLGDQKHGTNIEAPLSTIEEALENVYKRHGNNGGGSYQFTAQINRRTLFDEVINEAKLRRDVYGYNPFDLRGAKA